MARAPRNADGYVLVRSKDAAEDPRSHARSVLSLPATFSLIYESCDKRLCLFEDAAGHLSAVDATRLA